MANGKKIMIIEDEANLLYGLQAKFRVAGYEIIIDQGADKTITLEKIRTVKPDYLILDIILPRVDGFDLLAEVKADSAISLIPVFIFTNLSDADSRQRGKELGADFYFMKSELNLDEFVEKFQKIIINLKKIA